MPSANDTVKILQARIKGIEQEIWKSMYRGALAIFLLCIMSINTTLFICEFFSYPKWILHYRQLHICQQNLGCLYTILCVHATFWSGYLSINCKQVCIRVVLLNHIFLKMTFPGCVPWTICHSFFSHYEVK